MKKLTRIQLRNLVLREIRMLNEYPPRTWANRESWEDVDPIQQADGSWTDRDGRPWIPRGRPTGSGPSVPTDEYAAEHGYPWRPETDGPSLEDQLDAGVNNTIGSLEAAGFRVNVLEVRGGAAKVSIEMQEDGTIMADSPTNTSETGEVWITHNRMRSDW